MTDASFGPAKRLGKAVNARILPGVGQNRIPTPDFRGEPKFFNEIEISHDGEIRRDFVIQKPDFNRVSVQGRITFEGAAIGGETQMSYVLARKAMDFTLLGVFDGSGNYRLLGLSPGTYEIVAAIVQKKDGKPEGFSSRVELEVAPSRPSSLDIQITKRDKGFVPPK